jgi:endonuclease YncB( thermonuclease family)
MAKAIEQSKSGLTVGHFGLGSRGGTVGTIRHQVYDGDTINVRAIGNFGIRFLGVDAPEISFRLPGETAFSGLGHERWEAFLTDPFAQGLPPFDPPITPGLRNYLLQQIGPGAATNQRNHAEAAEDALEEEVINDMAALGQPEEGFQFFLAFAHEIMDRYGRLLCFINRHQPDPTVPKKRPVSYNERLLKEGKVAPYFIFPNLDPFSSKESITEAVIPPGTAAGLAGGDNALGQARKWVREARAGSVGLFQANDPLKLQPFEVRFLARRKPPDRWVIDLGKNDSVLIHPQKYYSVPRVEDRLYIPSQFVPLFVEAGWQKQD